MGITLPFVTITDHPGQKNRHTVYTVAVVEFSFKGIAALNIRGLPQFIHIIYINGK